MVDGGDCPLSCFGEKETGIVEASGKTAEGEWTKGETVWGLCGRDDGPLHSNAGAGDSSGFKASEWTNVSSWPRKQQA